MSLLINSLLALSAGFVLYNLALSFLGIYNSLKQSIIPVFSFTILIFISKIVFRAPPVIHTLVLVVLCSVFIFLFNNVSIIMSLISSLLMMIVVMMGSLLIICPLFDMFGIEIVIDNFESINWLYLNIGELSIPGSVLIINKITGTSMIKQILKLNILIQNRALESQQDRPK